MPLASEFGRLRVVLVATRNPLNLGAAARAMSNFGFLRLRVVNPYQIAFREARSAVGAEVLLRQAEEYTNVAQAVADCTLVVGTTSGARRDLTQPPRGLHEAARELRRQLLSGAVALLFGSEKRGLSNEDMSHCHWLLRIPTRAQHPSMNLGQAVAVCLYELARLPASTPAAEAPKLATAGQLERVTALLFQALDASGYVKPSTSASTEQKVRRLVRRLEMPADDIEIWLGMLRQIAWKLARNRT
ncbi:MAG TPA: TrmJ/YjtD family RNA methyltransferase [Terriglobales bacterium]|nr:TrmJ/YjtD family RNA methyltransferase [Terriglobales bacterium]